VLLSPQYLQALLAGVVQEAVDSAQATSEESEKLTRAREGAIESLKFDHTFTQHLGTLSLAAIAAFGAMLGGVFSDPKGRDDSLTILRVFSRYRLLG